MTLLLHPKRLLLSACLLAGFFLAPVTAQQGRSPFADQSPESTPVAVASPVAPTSATSWEIAETRAIEVDGQLVTLSPNGNWIAGLGPDRELCVWDIETLTPNCTLSDNDAPPSAESLRWSPDSTAVAFTMDAARLMVDSDIYVYERDGSILTNLTDDGFSGTLMLQAKDRPAQLPIDLGVTWSADSQTLFFGRTHWTEPQQQPEILAMGRQGGEPAVLTTLDTESPWGVIFPMVALPDGTIVYSITNGIPDDASEGLWMLPPSGDSVQLLSGEQEAEFPMPVVTDTRETSDGVVVTGLSLSLAGQFAGELPYTFTIYVDTGEVVPGEAFQTAASFLPNSDSMVFLQTDGSDATLVVETAGEIEPLGTIPRPRSEQNRGIEWSAANTILLVLDGSNATLVVMSPQRN